MPAFLVPKKGPPSFPRSLTAVAFLFANSPYITLGSIRGYLREDERALTYFTEGLASIVLLNFDLKQVKRLRRIAKGCPFEYWPLKHKTLDASHISMGMPRIRDLRHFKGSDIDLPLSPNIELAVYIEQISASLASLWASYTIYAPSELETLRRLSSLTTKLIKQYEHIIHEPEKTADELTQQKRKNAILSAVVEISGALSYAVTQGTSGGIPILSNRSPFPHHSLLGVGGAVRALTKFTRYLESAFNVRDAGTVIRFRYGNVRKIIPVRVPEYESGSEYKFPSADAKRQEQFDAGGEFRSETYIPLIANFSLRLGFMENKFFVTAASEALTAEI
jgi:hypothetical protein